MEIVVGYLLKVLLLLHVPYIHHVLLLMELQHPNVPFGEQLVYLMEFPVSQNLLVNYIIHKLLVLMQELMEYASMLFQQAQIQLDTVDYNCAQMLQQQPLQVLLHILDVSVLLQLHLVQHLKQDVFHKALVDRMVFRQVVLWEQMEYAFGQQQWLMKQQQLQLAPKVFVD